MYTLMIVDDSNIIRNKISRCQLNGAFTVVGSAKDGEEAVALFKKHQPDLVTMDLTMPKMDGLACIEAIIKINPRALILVVSALSDRLTALTAIANGARGFLNKPFTEEQLTDAVYKIMSTKNKQLS